MSVTRTVEGRVKDMPKITVTRYSEEDHTEFAGCIQPSDYGWILFVRRDGTPMLFTDRDEATGAYLPEHAL